MVSLLPYVLVVYHLRVDCTHFMFALFTL